MDAIVRCTSSYACPMLVRRFVHANSFAHHDFLQRNFRNCVPIFVNALVWRSRTRWTEMCAGASIDVLVPFLMADAKRSHFFSCRKTSFFLIYRTDVESISCAFVSVLSLHGCTSFVPTKRNELWKMNYGIKFKLLLINSIFARCESVFEIDFYLFSLLVAGWWPTTATPSNVQ